MKLKLILLLIVSATAAALLAQNPHTDYHFGIKLYNIATYDHYEDLRPVFPVGMNFNKVTTEDVRLLHPTIAFQWKSKRNNFHEIELTELKWDNTGTFSSIENDSVKSSQVIAGDQVQRTSAAIRYEYILVLAKKKTGSLVPAVGFALSPFYDNYHYQPRVETAFPESRMDAGIRAFVVPRLTWYVGNRFFLDMNLPVCVSDVMFYREKKEDPSIPASYRNLERFDVKMFPQYFSARIGIGIKI
ncbi:MAG: hypothetical protein ACJ77K_12450 [Bacteroidia bacterium]